MMLNASEEDAGLIQLREQADQTVRQANEPATREEIVLPHTPRVARNSLFGTCSIGSKSTTDDDARPHQMLHTPISSNGCRKSLRFQTAFV